MNKAIYFDMDGTIYDLYGVQNWLDKLQNEDVTAYNCGAPLYDMVKLNELLTNFIALGFTIGVITWTAKNGSKEYNKEVRKVKYAWIKENLPCVTEFHCVKYGTPKHTVCKIKNGILVDDNKEVREKWNGETVNAQKNILQGLEKILAKLENI
jgi:hypothetical protein